MPQLFETGLRRLRTELYQLSEHRFPGLRTRHYRLLSMISDEGTRLSRLASVSGLTKQALAQALQPLEAGGYVEASADPTDRRARVLRRSDRGREVIAAMQDVQRTCEQEWAAQVGAERWAAAKETLAQLFGP